MFRGRLVSCQTTGVTAGTLSHEGARSATTPSKRCWGAWRLRDRLQGPPQRVGPDRSDQDWRRLDLGVGRGDGIVIQDRCVGAG